MWMWADLSIFFHLQGLADGQDDGAASAGAAALREGKLQRYGQIKKLYDGKNGKNGNI
jgi:hypothetical protein